MQNTMNATTIRFSDSYSLQVIDKAVSLMNQTRTSFLISVSVAKAEEVIKEKLSTREEVENLMQLSPEASVNLAKRLLHPVKPNKNLVKAMKKYKEGK